MDLKIRKEAFAEVGRRLREYGNTETGEKDDLLERAVSQSVRDNSWFTEASVNYMMSSIAESLVPHQLDEWTEQYDLSPSAEPKTLAVVMAGNVPAVGFHDFLSVLISGHALLAKLSTDDKHLIPALAGMLIEIEPAFRARIDFTDDKLSGFDAVIATGSNNTSRYFEYYFGKYPNIIRKNRNGVGVITGTETIEHLKSLGEDIFTYYGLGCRNISKLFIPRDYNLQNLFIALEDYSEIGDHHKYRNNYDYNKSIFLVNGDTHYDNGFLLLKEDSAIASPVSVLNFERYDDIRQINDILRNEHENIQCIVSASGDIENAIPPGTSQHPKLWDYADGVDTMEFLLMLTVDSTAV